MFSIFRQTRNTTRHQHYVGTNLILNPRCYYEKFIQKRHRSTDKVVFGRFDINTSERHKMIKAILANSDNCGDLICGDPKEVKDIIKKDPEVKIKSRIKRERHRMALDKYNEKK